MLDAKNKSKIETLLDHCRKNLKKVNEDLVRRAFEVSLEAHRHDLRESGEPYFHHPYNVALILAKEIPLDDVSVASALLHDIVEDTGYSLISIKDEFGKEIADIVDGVTKISDIFKSHEITQAESYRKLLISMVNDVRVMLVKFADRLDNMRTLEHLPKERQQRLSRETLDIYAPFAHRFGLANVKWEFEDLAFEYLYPEQHDKILKQLRSTRREQEHYIKKFIAPIEKKLQEEGKHFQIEGRPKHLYSIYRKMEKKGKPLDATFEYNDILAVRIILDSNDRNECFAVYGTVSEIYNPIPQLFKDFISVPKKNGYQSIHTTVVGQGGRLVEVQIRTKAMHEVSEKGVAAHWIYKENKASIDKELENWVNWVREIFEQKSEETPKELMESFRLALYQDEIYVFTPKGELKILPRNATPVDFAFEIHSDIGWHCIGAKVSGRIVPLNTLLRSGDQLEIITSKNQTPNLDWEKFVVTHKAKTQIRKWIKEEQRRVANQGKEIWDKKLKRHKLKLREEDFNKLVQSLKFENVQRFYLAIAGEKLDIDAVLVQLVNLQRKVEEDVPGRGSEEPKSLFSKFVNTARDIAKGISVFGSSDNFMHQYAKCCNPIPGDEIVGFVTIGEGIKIHRKDCKNVISMRMTLSERVVEVAWPTANGADFIAAIHIAGNDRPALLSDITHAISSYQNTNIRSVNVDSKDQMFSGQIILYVQNTEHLRRILEKIQRVSGVSIAERFLG